MNQINNKSNMSNASNISNTSNNNLSINTAINKRGSNNYKAQNLRNNTNTNNKNNYSNIIKDSNSSKNNINLNRSYAGEDRNILTSISDLKKKINESRKSIINPLSQSQILPQYDNNDEYDDNHNITEESRPNTSLKGYNYSGNYNTNSNTVSVNRLVKNSNISKTSIGSSNVSNVGARLNEIKAKIKQQNSINSYKFK